MTETQIATMARVITPVLVLPQNEEEFDILHKATLELAELLEGDPDNPMYEVLMKMVSLIEEYEDKKYPDYGAEKE